ncbi:nitroreductase family protein [Vibrio splendidus]
MLRKIRHLFYYIKTCVNVRSLKPLNFYIRHFGNVKKFSDDFLVDKLKHETHLLEKCTKNNPSNRGEERYLYSKKLLEEIESRRLSEDAITCWARNVFDKYSKWKVGSVPLLDEKFDGIFKTSKYETISTRFFEDKNVDYSDIVNCVKVAQQAPASCNRQAFKVVICKGNMEYELGEANNASLFEKSPYRIFIFVNEDNYLEKFSPAIDVGMFAQNFILQAADYGIATCCCYAAEHLECSQDHYRKKYGLGKSYYCYLTIVLGYPAESAIKPPRRSVDKLIVEV